MERHFKTLWRDTLRCRPPGRFAISLGGAWSAKRPKAGVVVGVQLRPWRVEHASSPPGYAAPRVAGGGGYWDRFPVSASPRDPRTQRCLHAPPGRDRSAEAAQVGESSASRSCAPPPLPPHWPFAGANGGKRGEVLRSEIYQRGSSRGCHVRGGHDGPESRLRPRESVGVLAFAKLPRTGRRSQPQASAWGLREPPVFQRGFGGALATCRREPGFDVWRKFSPQFPPGLGLFVGSSSSR